MSGSVDLIWQAAGQGRLDSHFTHTHICEPAQAPPKLLWQCRPPHLLGRQAANLLDFVSDQPSSGRAAAAAGALCREASRQAGKVGRGTSRPKRHVPWEAYSGKSAVVFFLG